MRTSLIDAYLESGERELVDLLAQCAVKYGGCEGCAQYSECLDWYSNLSNEAVKGKRLKKAMNTAAIRMVDGNSDTG